MENPHSTGEAGVYCPACGKENPDHARFCRHCGTRMPDLATETTTDAELELIDSSGEFIGQTLGRYRVLRKLRTTSTGIVFRALDTQLDRIVALKILPHGLGLEGSEAPSPVEEEEALEAFREEVNLAANLEHPNILPVHDFGRFGNCYFVVMKQADGHSLARHIEKRAPLAPVEMLRIGIQIATALVYLHKRFIIHGRLSPSGIILQDSGHVLIRDITFLGRKVPRPLSPQEKLYQAPELADSGTLDARSDIYSLGVILYQLLTGHLPYTEEGGEADELTVRGVPLSLEELLISMIQRDPEKRVNSVEDVRERLRRAYSLSITSMAGEEDLTGEFIDFSRLSTAQEADRRVILEGMLGALAKDIDLKNLKIKETDAEALDAIAAGEPAPVNSIGRLSFYSALDETVRLARMAQLADALENLAQETKIGKDRPLPATRSFLSGVAERERKLKRARFILGNNLVTEFRRAAESFSQVLTGDSNCEEAREGLAILSSLGEFWQQTQERKMWPKWLMPTLIAGGALALTAVFLLIFSGAEPGMLADTYSPRGFPPGGIQSLLGEAAKAEAVLVLPTEPMGEPTFSGDWVLVPLEGATLAAYSLASGQEVWRQSNFPADHPPLVYRREIITASGQQLTLRDSDGSIIATHNLEERLAGIPALGPEGQLYVANEKGAIYAFDLATPKRLRFLWRISSQARPAGLFPTPAGKRLLVSFIDGSLILFDGFNGGELWRYQIEDAVVLTARSPQPVITSNAVYIATNRLCFALSLDDGSLLWQEQLLGPLGNPAFWEGSLFVPSGDGRIYRLLADNGNVVGSENLGTGLMLERPLVCGSELIIRLTDKRLLSVGTADLRPVKRELPKADFPLAAAKGSAWLVRGSVIFRLSSSTDE
ncbi:MAG TPA: zinc-ribbon domain-containing protein [Candidatus Coatesbacteria bacterium]|nr:zinc-ribbon domain-containing protein [Candidatus Coatesbacteria bacterium]